MVLWDSRSDYFVGQIATEEKNNKRKNGMLTHITANSRSMPNLVICGFEDGTVKFGDIRKLQYVLEADNLFTNPIMSMAVSPTASKFAIGSSDSSVRLFQADELSDENRSMSLSVLSEFDVTAGTSSLSYRDDGRVLASSHWNGDINVYDAKKHHPLAKLSYHLDGLAAVAFCKSASESLCPLLASAGKTSEIAIWNLF